MIPIPYPSRIQARSFACDLSSMQSSLELDFPLWEVFLSQTEATSFPFFVELSRSIGFARYTCTELRVIHLHIHGSVILTRVQPYIPLLGLSFVLGRSLIFLDGGMFAPKEDEDSPLLFETLLPRYIIRRNISFLWSILLKIGDLNNRVFAGIDWLTPPLLSKEENEQYGNLFYFEVPKLKVLLSDKILFNMEIILAWPRGGRNPGPSLFFFLQFFPHLIISSLFNLYNHGSFKNSRAKKSGHKSKDHCSRILEYANKD